MPKTKPKPGVRWTLLVLLWAWALCMALVLDLFRNVEAFDRIRPDTRLYRATRFAAHRMVGEPYRERDEFVWARRTPTAPSASPTLAPAVSAVSSRPSPRFRTPDSPQGRRFLQGLRRVASTSPDPARRIAAVRGIARIFRDRDALRAVADDPAQQESVRAAARRHLEKGDLR
jgi:hypothetical protein